jgi:phosphoglycolate phosphatase-like HAD superfamily hydrolase
LGVAPEQVALVGDTAADIQAAKAAGAVAVGVLCGFGERDDLEQADLILESTAELAEWL